LERCEASKEEEKARGKNYKGGDGKGVKWNGDGKKV